MANINDTYFDGAYKEIWRTLIPDELTVKEVDFMFPYFNLESGSKVLDLMCGYGRHAIALAKKNVEVTAVDNLDDYINEINDIAEKDNLSLKALKGDTLHYKSAEVFDLVLCMGNSFQFFNPDDASQLLSNIAAQLKAGGHLLINSWSIAEIAIKNFKGKDWSKIGDSKFLTDSKFLFNPTRIESESILINADGSTEIKSAVDYIYSLNEMEAMLIKAGFKLKEVYSIPGRKKFTLGEPRAYLVAEKV